MIFGVEDGQNPPRGLQHKISLILVEKIWILGIFPKKNIFLKKVQNFSM